MQQVECEQILKQWSTIDIYCKKWSIVGFNSNEGVDFARVVIITCDKRVELQIEKDYEDDFFFYWKIKTLLKPLIRLFYEDPITGDMEESLEVDEINVSGISPLWSDTETIEVEKEN